MSYDILDQTVAFNDELTKINAYIWPHVHP